MSRALLRISLATALLLLLPTSLGMTFYVERPVNLTPGGLHFGAGVRSGESIDSDDNDACGRGAEWYEGASTATGSGHLGSTGEGAFDEEDWSRVRAYRTEILTASVAGVGTLQTLEGCRPGALPVEAEIEETGDLWFGVRILDAVPEGGYNLTYAFQDNDDSKRSDAPNLGPVPASLVASPLAETTPARLSGSLSGRAAGGDFDYYGIDAPASANVDAIGVLTVVAVSFEPDCGSGPMSFTLYEADALTQLGERRNDLACGTGNVLACLSVGPASLQVALGLPAGSGTGYDLRAATLPAHMVEVDGMTELILDARTSDPSDMLDLIAQALQKTPPLPPWCDAKSAQAAPTLAELATQTEPADETYRKLMNPINYVLGKLPLVLP